MPDFTEFSKLKDVKRKRSKHPRTELRAKAELDAVEAAVEGIPKALRTAYQRYANVKAKIN